jgi:beta-galactosidase
MKDIYYFYKASLTKKPIIHIASRDWDERIEGLSDFGKAEVPVKIYTNLDDVNISLNDRSLGLFVNEGSNIINIDLPLKLGQNKILAEYHEIVDSVNITLRENISSLRTLSKGEEIAINVGASNQFIDPNGLIWIPEEEYKQDLMGYIGGKPKYYSTSPSILGTDNDPLYQTYREGIESFRFDVPDGEYEIELCFVEDKNQGVDTRCMNIILNDELKFENLDLVRSYGFLKAVSIIDKIFVKDGKGINISFDSIIGQTILSAIRVKML